MNYVQFHSRTEAAEAAVLGLLVRLLFAIPVQPGGRIPDLCHQAFPPAPKVHRRGAQYPLRRGFAFFGFPKPLVTRTSVRRELHRLLLRSGGLRSRVAAKAPGRSGRHIPAIVTRFEPNRRLLVAGVAAGSISSRRLQAGRRQPFVDVRCGLCVASFPQERLALFACRRRKGLSS